MTKAQHIEHCRQILGRGFPEVHDWLDKFADKLGPEHRKVRHNAKAVKEIIEKHGYLAGAAACLHIYADNVGLIMTNDGKFVTISNFKTSITQPPV